MRAAAVVLLAASMAACASVPVADFCKKPDVLCYPGRHLEFQKNENRNPWEFLYVPVIEDEAWPIQASC